jgi:hypothetical protein
MRILIFLLFLFITKAGIAQSKCAFEIDSIRVILNEGIPTFITALSNERLTSIRDVDSIPPIIKSAIACKKKEFQIANHNQPFQVTDVKSRGKRLPWRQLTYLGVSDRYVVLAYKHGGIALANHVLLFRIEDNKIIDFWGGSGKEINNKSQLIAFLKSITGINGSYFIL